MHLTTACVGAHVTPAAIATWFAHYLDRKSRRHKPTAHVSYDEGLNIIRQFIRHSSYHTVEDIQAFTGRYIPTPHWVRIQEEVIPEEYLSKAASAIIDQLGPRGLLRVGGKQWWQWRGPLKEMKGEWIEMKGDYHARTRNNAHGRRVMLYVHGGAYYFGSIDTHRYQMQRHARKLKARVFAPSYRLAPQFPFPCGLQDCLAAYLYLLTMQDPTEIILAGDSAGAGMVVSMLVILRDRGLPLPAGAILISPWVDLTHSFPSVAEGSPLDYIPEHGFFHRPSRAWPPPNSDDLVAIQKGAEQEIARRRSSQTAVQGFTVREETAAESTAATQPVYPGVQSELGPVQTHQILHNEADNLAVPMQDGVVVEVKDQIQMYAPNQLLSHPLVSPILQPSLGGLPPLLILSGGGEMLRDEQIYLAHKAADPAGYPPNDAYLDEHDPDRTILNKYEPTYVQLQVFDDLCHVAPTLGWTRPAKFMYRSVAQFGAWALARAQKEEIDIPEDDASTSSGRSTKSSTSDMEQSSPSSVGKAGDPLPSFHKHMIRQRVDRHGKIYPLDHPSALQALQLSPTKVGAINPGILTKWLAAKKKWDKKYAKEKLRVQQHRIRDLEQGYYGFDGETPPACALASRRREQDIVPQQRRQKSYSMMLWSMIASKHDKAVMKFQEKAAEVPHSSNTGVDGPDSRVVNEKTSKPRDQSLSQQKSERERALCPQSNRDRDRYRSMSRSRIVSDAGQANGTAEKEQKGTTSVPENGSVDVPRRETGAPSEGASGVASPISGDTPTILISGLDVNASPSSSALENASTRAVLHAPGVIGGKDTSSVNTSSSDRWEASSS